MSSWIREEAYVENKFLEQLDSLGWNILKIKDIENKNRTAEISFKVLQTVISDLIKS